MQAISSAARHRFMIDRRPRHPAGRRARPGTRPRRPSSPVARTLFHAPSFSAGAVMGALLVLGAAYVPELLENDAPPTAASASARPADSPPQLTFEFDDLLRNSQVVADPPPAQEVPEARPATGETAGEAVRASTEFLLQAASFRSEADAERLRAALLLLDLPAATQSISLPSGVWYRVIVGPFDSEAVAERALTRLRENDIAAIWARR
jgi:hypothetical protein